MSRKPAAKPLKVFGGSGFRHDPRNTNRHRQTREIVAATSLTAALRLMHPFGVRRDNCCETGNELEVSIAMSKPGTVFWCPLNSWLQSASEYFESQEEER